MLEIFTPKLIWKSPIAYNLAKSTGGAGALHLAREKQSTHPSQYDELFRIAGLAASKVNNYDMPYEDRKQEALWVIWFNLDRIRAADRPAALAYTVAWRHLANLYKRHKKFGQWPVSNLKLPNDRSITENLSALVSKRDMAGEFWRSERAETMIGDLHDALAQLEDRERVIVRGFYGFDGDKLSISQIARLLSPISEDWVKELKGRAIEKLRTILLAPSVPKLAA